MIPIHSPYLFTDSMWYSFSVIIDTKVSKTDPVIFRISNSNSNSYSLCLTDQQVVLPISTSEYIPCF